MTSGAAVLLGPYSANSTTLPTGVSGAYVADNDKWIPLVMGTGGGATIYILHVEGDS